MVIVDSHCHLDRIDLKPYGGCIAHCVRDAASVGVEYMLSVSVTLDSYPTMRDGLKHHDNVFLSCGVHPLNQNSGWTQERLLKLADDPKVVAIGETGLDYYYDKDSIEQQQQGFRAHIQAARQLNLPLIIHTRDARADTLRIMDEEGAEQVGGVLHCFTEDLAMAEQAMARNFYISISGIVTFNAADGLREVVEALPLDRLLVETDSPYLTPVPNRGKPNYPGYTRYVVEKVAEIKGLEPEVVAKATTDNFFTLFSKAQR